MFISYSVTVNRKPEIQTQLSTDMSENMIPLPDKPELQKKQKTAATTSQALNTGSFKAEGSAGTCTMLACSDLRAYGLGIKL